MGGIAAQPLHSQGSPNKGTKSEVAASPLPCRGPASERNCYVTPTFSGIPKQGNKIRKSCLTLAFSEAHNQAELLCHPCILGGFQHQARGENQKWLPHPCLLIGPQLGGIAMSPLHSPGSTTPSAENKIRSGCLTPTF